MDIIQLECGYPPGMSHLRSVDTGGLVDSSMFTFPLVPQPTPNPNRNPKLDANPWKDCALVTTYLGSRALVKCYAVRAVYAWASIPQTEIRRRRCPSVESAPFSLESHCVIPINNPGGRRIEIVMSK